VYFVLWIGSRPHAATDPPSVRRAAGARLGLEAMPRFPRVDASPDVVDLREMESVMDVHTLASPAPAPAGSHLLRFASLYEPGRALAVPCNAAGIVDLDSLSQRLRVAYLGARALVGREYACPVVQFAC